MFWYCRATLGALLVIFASDRATLAQEPYSHGHAPALKVVADGATEPARIPDHLAYAHFILSIAAPDSPTEAQSNHRAAMLAPLGLTKRDEAAAVAALAGVHGQIEFLRREVERVSGTKDGFPAKLDDINVARSRTLSQATERLSKALSRDGLVRLQDYIARHVKPRIVIYAPPE